MDRASDQPIAVDVLTAAECAALREQIHALREEWVNKGHGTKFYTLGVSAYLDAQYRGPIAYTLAAKRQRPLMAATFSDSYERVRLALEGALGEPVIYHERHALPGFHIFLADRTFEIPVCRVHIDMPYLDLPWPSYEPVDRERTISFTLAIALPKAGGGLNMWPGIEPDLAPVGPSPAQLTAGIEPVFHRYTPGRMLIHHGHTIHQIAPFEVQDEHDERITLQGHAIHSARGWLAYF